MVPNIGSVVSDDLVRSWSIGSATNFSGDADRLGVAVNTGDMKRLVRGQLLLCSVSGGHYQGIQDTAGRSFPAFEFRPLSEKRLVLCAVGPREAASEHNGELPTDVGDPQPSLKLLSSAGLVGVATSHSKSVTPPNSLELHCAFQRDGRLVNSEHFSTAVDLTEVSELRSQGAKLKGQGPMLIVVTAEGMDMGKTTACRSLVQSLMSLRSDSSLGPIAVAKVTGSANREGPYAYQELGVEHQFDFSVVPGVPSTVGLDTETLLQCFWSQYYLLRKRVAAGEKRGVLLVEFGDGLDQAETHNAIFNREIAQVTEQVLFACSDVEAAVRAREDLLRFKYPEPIYTGRLASNERRSVALTTRLEKFTEPKFFDSQATLSESGVLELLL